MKKCINIDKKRVIINYSFFVNNSKKIILLYELYNFKKNLYIYFWLTFKRA